MQLFRRLAAISLASCLILLPSCADRSHHIVVSVPEQRMAVFKKDQLLATFPISTSRFALGDVPGSNGTPLGRLEIAEKIGAGQPLGMKFKSRRPTGEIVPVNAPGRDPIVTRILWLRGRERWNANAYGRYIYIHGTPEEARLGTPASFGCVRMASRDVVWLFDTVGKGCQVDISTQPLATAARNRS
jgi:lipoprotein-anchoring transpeptidase ErfK/SrfK